jgi:hypothetical protein
MAALVAAWAVWAEWICKEGQLVNWRLVDWPEVGTRQFQKAPRMRGFLFWSGLPAWGFDIGIALTARRRAQRRDHEGHIHFCAVPAKISSLCSARSEKFSGVMRRGIKSQNRNLHDLSPRRCVAVRVILVMIPGGCWPGEPLGITLVAPVVTEPT